MHRKEVYRDESFGIIPVSKESGEWQVFLIQHRHGRYWGYPKGHAESDENPQETAARELKEETNLDVVCFIQNEPLKERYQFTLEGRRIDKQVFYFLAEVTGTVQLQKKEIQDGLWLPVDQAIEKITHSEGKVILAQAASLLLKR